MRFSVTVLLCSCAIAASSCRSRSTSAVKITKAKYVGSAQYPHNLYVTDLDCSAVAIAPRVLMTAAHCVTELTADFKSEFLTPSALSDRLTLVYDWTEESRSLPPNSRIGIKKIAIHPTWMVMTDQVIKEFQELKQQDPSLELPSRELLLTYVADRDVSDVALIAVDADLPKPSVKMIASENIVLEGTYELTGNGCDDAAQDHRWMASNYLGMTPVVAKQLGTHKILMTSSTGASTCPGDSGGPTYRRTANNELSLVGVTSVAEYLDDETAVPGTYVARVDVLKGWIAEFQNGL